MEFLIDECDSNSVISPNLYDILGQLDQQDNHHNDFTLTSDMMESQVTFSCLSDNTMTNQNQQFNTTNMPPFSNNFGLTEWIPNISNNLNEVDFSNLVYEDAAASNNTNDISIVHQHNANNQTNNKPLFNSDNDSDSGICSSSVSCDSENSPKSN